MTRTLSKKDVVYKCQATAVDLELLDSRTPEQGAVGGLCVESLLSGPRDNLSAQFSYFASQGKQSPLTIFVGSAD